MSINRLTLIGLLVALTSYVAAFYIDESGYWLEAGYVKGIGMFLGLLVIAQTLQVKPIIYDAIHGFIIGCIYDECRVSFVNGDWVEPPMWPTYVSALIFAAIGFFWRKHEKKVSRAVFSIGFTGVAVFGLKTVFMYIVLLIKCILIVVVKFLSIVFS